jgi:hypothetical protein
MNVEAGREMDALIVETVMGGFVDDPDTQSQTDEPWYYRRSGRIIRGVAYSIGEVQPGWYERTWDEWSPSTDIAAAWTIVDQMQLLDEHMLYKGSDSLWHVAERYDEYGDDTPSMIGSRVTIAVADTAPLAICLAALKVTNQ